jgi:hypothetical protein
VQTVDMNVIVFIYRYLLNRWKSKIFYVLYYYQQRARLCVTIKLIKILASAKVAVYRVVPKKFPTWQKIVDGTRSSRPQL